MGPYVARRGRFTKYTPYVRAAVGAYRLASGARKAAKGMMSFTKTKKRSVDTGFTSNQHDVRTQYVKKRMPARKRKQWTSFVKKVNAVSDNDRGVTTFVFNKRGGTGCPSIISGVRQQAAAETHIYGLSGTETTAGLNNMAIGSSDLKFIFDNDPLLVAGVGSGTAKLRFHSACMDVTVRNNTDSIMELDCYEVEYHKSVGTFGTLQSTMDAAMNNSQLVATGIAGTSRISINTRGVTPFDMGPAISAAKMKILKKTKYFVGPSQVITRQFRDPKNRFLDEQYYARRTGGVILPGFTRTLIWIGKRQDGALATDATALEIGCTTTYKYTIEGVNQDRNLYVQN